MGDSRLLLFCCPLGLGLLLLLDDSRGRHLSIVERPHGRVEGGLARSVGQIEPPLRHRKEGGASTKVRCGAGKVQAIRSRLAKRVCTVGHLG